MALQSIVKFGCARFFIKPAVAPCFIQVSHISGCHGKPKQWPKPYLIADKKFNLFKQLMDRTVSRLTEDSKVIVVEGMPGSGKTKFAERLAKELDFHLIPAFDANDIFTFHDSGFDVRSLAFKLEKDYFYDLETFYKDPNPESMRAGGLQWGFYKNRFYNYAKALLHLLSTGQGIVMDGSVYSDHVYANALYKCKYMSRPALQHYNMIRANTICELFKPHVSIFLDVPLSVIQQRLQQRNSVEKNSKALTSSKYVAALDDGFRNNFLPTMRQYGEVLTYAENEIDWEIIVEDLEQLYLEYEKYVEYKFEDWNRPRDADFAHYRKLYSDDDGLASLFTMSFPFDCPEIVNRDVDDRLADYFFQKHPEVAYAPGFNPAKNSQLEIMFK